jgi:hypothetical protein
VSRTVRRVLFGRTKGCRSGGARFDTQDLNILKHPPRLMDQNRGHWEMQWGRMVYAPGYEYGTRIYSYWEQRGHYKTPSKEYYRGDYVSMSDEYQSKRWIPNPDFDEDEYDYYYAWWNIHSHVYRNASVVRKQINSRRDDKRVNTRSDRNKGKRESRHLLREYEIGDSL